MKPVAIFEEAAQLAAVDKLPTRGVTHASLLSKLVPFTSDLKLTVDHKIYPNSSLHTCCMTLLPDQTILKEQKTTYPSCQHRPA